MDMYSTITLILKVSKLVFSYFIQNLEAIQYGAVFVRNETIRGTSSEKLFQELGLETFKSRSWLRKLCLFQKYFIINRPIVILLNKYQILTAHMLQEVLKTNSFLQCKNFFLQT